MDFKIGLEALEKFENKFKKSRKERKNARQWQLLILKTIECILLR